MKQPFRKEIILLFIQHAAVVAIGVLIFLLDKFEGFSDAINFSMLFILTIGKSVYFVFHNFRSITKVVQSDKQFNHFIVLVSVNIALIVISFAMDYFCMIKIYPTVFKGNLASDDLRTLAEMLYFSLITFTTTGFGDIVPASNLARSVVSLEVVVAYVSTIFIISNFSNFSSIAVKD